MRILTAFLVITSLALPASGQEIVVAATEIARTLALEIQQEEQKSVAISTFRDLQGARQDLVDFFSEELMNQLIANKGSDFTVVERSRTDAVFAEQKLGLDGLRASSKLDAVVKVLAVDAIVVGTISTLPELGGKIRINARLIAVPSGEALASASAFLCSSDPVLPNRTAHDSETKSPIETTTPVESSLMTKTARDFLFELKGCKQDAGALNCNFVVTNKAGDRVLQILNKSRIFTAAPTSDEFISERQILGSRNTTGTAGIETIGGIQVQGALQFEGVPPQSENLQLLDIRCWSDDHFSVQFFDVPIH